MIQRFTNLPQGLALVLVTLLQEVATVLKLFLANSVAPMPRNTFVLRVPALSPRLQHCQPTPTCLKPHLTQMIRLAPPNLILLKQLPDKSISKQPIWIRLAPPNLILLKQLLDKSIS